MSHPGRPLCGCGYGTVSPGASRLGRKFQVTACPVLSPKPWPDPCCGPQVLPLVTDDSCPPDTRMCFSALISISIITTIHSFLPTYGDKSASVYTLTQQRPLLESHSICSLPNAWHSPELPQNPVNSRGRNQLLIPMRKLRLSAPGLLTISENTCFPSAGHFLFQPQAAASPLSSTSLVNKLGMLSASLVAKVDYLAAPMESKGPQGRRHPKGREGGGESFGTGSRAACLLLLFCPSSEIFICQVQRDSLVPQHALRSSPGRTHIPIGGSACVSSSCP